MDIRKIIRETIEKAINEEGTENPILGSAVEDIGAMLQADMDNINNIIDTQKTDLKNAKVVFKQDSQKKNAISPKIGDIVSFHWGSVCSILNIRELANIKKWTAFHLDIANKTI